MFATQVRVNFNHEHFLSSKFSVKFHQMIFDAKQEILKFLFSCWCLFFVLLGLVWRKFNGEDVLIGNQFYSTANLRLFVVFNYVISWSSDITFPPKSKNLLTMLHTICNLREFIWQSGASRIGHHFFYFHDFKYLMQGWNC